MKLSPELSQAFDDLLRLAEKGRLSYESFGFGLYVIEPQISIPSNVWDAVDQYCPNALIYFPNPTTWLDGRDSQCIRWYGDGQGVEAFKRWADDLYIALVKTGVVSPNWIGIKGYHGSIRYLCDSAMQHSHLASTVRTDEVVIPQSNVSIRYCLDQMNRRLATFTFFQPDFDAILFAERVLMRINGAEVPARLSVDLDSDTATCHGKIYSVRRQAVLVLDMLIGRAGEIVSRNSMRATHDELRDDQHLERQIEHLQRDHPAIGDLIEKIPGKGYRIARTHVD